MNELLFFAIFVVVIILALFAFRLGRNYVFAFIGTIATLTFFLAPMVIVMFGFAFALSELFYAILFFTTDMISEHYGKKDAHSLVWLAVLVSVTIAVLTSVATIFTPHTVDFIQPHIEAILRISPRLLGAAFIMFIIEQHFDIWAFHKLRQKTKGKKLWLRNILSTGTTQLIDVLFFYPLAFYGIYENLIELMIVAFVFKILMAMLDTPFIYLSYRFKPKELLKTD